MAKVYVVQIPRSRAPNGSWREWDITPAQIYGELTSPLIDRTGASLHTQHTVQALRKLLADYSDEDSLLAIGDPAAIAVCAAIAADANRGVIAVLRWDRRTKSYIRFPYNIRGSSVPETALRYRKERD